MRTSLKSGVIAVLAAASIGTAVATPTIAPASPTAPLSDQLGRHLVASPYPGRWVTSGWSVDIAPRGTATVGRFDIVAGMAHGDTWAARWAPAGRSIVLTFTRRTQRIGFFRSVGVRPGTRWTGRVVRQSGHDRLLLSALPGVGLCRSTDTQCW